LVELYHDIDEDILSARNNESVILKALRKKGDPYPYNSVWQIEPSFGPKYDSISSSPF